MNLDLEIMQPESMKAYYLIKDFIRRQKLQTGGCKTFYTPTEWNYRNEEHCNEAILVMVYDGSQVKHIIGTGKFTKYLKDNGYYLEQGLHWYCGIYKK